MIMPMRAAWLLPALVIVGCVSSSRTNAPAPLLDAACVRQCDQIYWTCNNTCGQTVGAQISCEMIRCGPVRSQCLAKCPAIARQSWYDCWADTGIDRAARIERVYQAGDIDAATYEACKRGVWDERRQRYMPP